MYAGLSFSAQSVDVKVTAAAFAQIMSSQFNAIVSEETRDNTLMLTAGAFHGNLASCYEITLTCHLDTGKIDFTAWGDAAEMNSDDLANELAPMAATLFLDTVTGEFSEQEADADEDEIDTFTFALPSSWVAG